MKMRTTNLSLRKGKNLPKSIPQKKREMFLMNSTSSGHIARKPTKIRIFQVFWLKLKTLNWLGPLSYFKAPRNRVWKENYSNFSKIGFLEDECLHCFSTDLPEMQSFLTCADGRYAIWRLLSK